MGGFAFGGTFMVYTEIYGDSSVVLDCFQKLREKKAANENNFLLRQLLSYDG